MMSNQYGSFVIYKLVKEKAKPIECPPPFLCTIGLCCDHVPSYPLPPVYPAPKTCANFQCHGASQSKPNSAGIQCEVSPSDTLFAKVDGSAGERAKDARALPMVNLGSALFFGCVAALACTSLVVYRNRRKPTRETRAVDLSHIYHPLAPASTSTECDIDGEIESSIE
jgi:hypothetical protein